MAVFKCKICGGTLEINVGETVATCEYCGTKQTLPKLDDEKKANLFDRANHFRRNNDFDKAMGIYEQILNEDTEDAESYWSIVLCRYGIEYVEDPSSRKRVPTVNRAQFTSVFDDEDYKSAIKYADNYQKDLYEQEARTINEIQKGILAISQKEEPFDVFICYKETDNNGRRTQDSVLATELYHELTKEGFKVFFSRITLEDKLGVAYEPYIFAALHSAKVMVAIGTKPEHFNAVWVKNEWSRYLSLIKNGVNKILIPAYRDMDPYDLPEEFSHLQAQDMSRLGFMQDLVRGIKKLVSTDTATSVKETVVVQSAASGSTNIEPLLKRAFMFLEDCDWKSANEYCEKVLDLEPENADAYLGKLLAELRVTSREKLADCAEPFNDKNSYQKAIRFGDKSLGEELKGYVSYITNRNEETAKKNQYNLAVELMEKATTEEEFLEVAGAFEKIPGYGDANSLAEECHAKATTTYKNKIYDEANRKMDQNQISSYEDAIKLFGEIPEWRDSESQIDICKKRIEAVKVKHEKEDKMLRKMAIIACSVVVIAILMALLLSQIVFPAINYKKATTLMKNQNYKECIELFETLGNYKDSRELAKNVNYIYAEKLYKEGQYKESAIAYGKAKEHKDSKMRAFEVWEMVANRETISADEQTVALQRGGTVVACGANYSGQCDVTGWSDIVDISAGSSFTAGLRSDGTVVLTDSDYDISGWENIVAVSTDTCRVLGLRIDGTVVACGANNSGESDVNEWTDIVAISAGHGYTIGLKADGTVVACGVNYGGQCDVTRWTDIVDISAGSSHTVGLKSDGTVVACGFDDYGRFGNCDVSGWTDIVAISAGQDHTIGLKADGTVVATGRNNRGQCDVFDWNHIKLGNS